MKLSKQLNVSSSDFYEILINSLKEELKLANIFDVEPYEGLTYEINKQRYTQTDIKSKCTILTLKQNKEYSIQIETALDITTITYKIEEITKDKIIVNYQDIPSGKTTFTHLNHKIIGETFGWLYQKKRVKLKLKNIETFCINTNKVS